MYSFFKTKQQKLMLFPFHSRNLVEETQKVIITLQCLRSALGMCQLRKNTVLTTKNTDQLF